MSNKFVVETYTFDASAQTVDIPSVSGLQLDGIILITNKTDNIDIYVFNDPLKGGTLSGTTLTLTFDTTTMDDTDVLQIIYDAPTDSKTSSVIGDTSLPVAGVSVALPVGIVDGSGNQMGESGNPVHIFQENFTYTTPPIVTSVNVTPVGIVDDAGNQMGDSGNPMIVDAGNLSIPVSGATVALPTAIVDGSGNQITSFGGGTQYTENATPPTDMIGTAIAGRYTTSNTIEIANVSDLGDSNFAIISGPVTGALWTHAQVKLDIGGNTVAQTGKTVGSENAASVAIVDGSGNQITSFGGGTEYSVANTPPADPVGGTLLFEDTGAAWQSVGVGAGDGKPLPVGIYDDAGAQMGTAGNPLNVTGGGGGTQYAEGDALGSTPTGTVDILRDASDNAIVPTADAYGTKVAQHVLTVDSSGDPRPPATLYQDADTAVSGDLAPGVAFKDAAASGNWNVTGLHAPFPVHLRDVGGDEVGALGSSPVGNELGIVVRNIPQTKMGSATVTSTANDVTITDIGGMSSAMIYVSGTYSATLAPYVSVDNGSTYSPIGLLKGAWTIYDVHKGTYHYEISGGMTGIYQVNIAGCNAFKLDCVAFTSGSATVQVCVSNASGAPQGKTNHQNVALAITLASGSGNKTLISALASYKFRITSFNFMSSAATTFQFKDGTGGSVLTGPYQLAANTGISVPYNERGYFDTLTTNTALVGVVGTAADIGGLITYTIIE